MAAQSPLRRIQPPIALPLLLVLLGCWALAADAATRLGLHITDVEVALWKTRMTDNATTMNGVTFQQIYQQRLLADANAFRSQRHPGGDGFWAGYTGGGCAPNGNTTAPKPGSAGSPYGRGNGARMARAAFVFLLTGETSYADPVKAELLNQIRQAGTDWTNGSKWCLSKLGSQNTIETIPWLYRLLLAYDYLDAGGYAGFSATDRAQIAAWFRSAATLFDTGHRNGTNKGAYKGIYATPQTLTCTGSHCSAMGPLLYFGGPSIREAHNGLHNVGTMVPLFSTAIGLKFNDATQLRHGKAWLSAFLRIGLWDNGAMQDFTRWRDCSPSCPGSMWSHAGGVWGPVTAAADMLARTGDASLYTLKAPTQILGGRGGMVSWQTALRLAAEMANKTTRLYGTTSASSLGPSTLLSWDSGTPDKGQYYDFSALAANVFYQDPVITQAMERPLRAGNHPSTGCYDDQFGGCFSGVWAWWPDLPFMYGKVGSQIQPYTGVTLPPVAPPPTQPPQAPTCNVDLAWEYPQLLHASVQYDLHIVTLVGGQPTTMDQPVRPMRVQDCPLALTADGWQAVCTCVCVPEGDASLTVTARREGETSPPSNVLDLDVTAQTACVPPTPPIAIPMVAAPSSESAVPIAPVVAGAAVGAAVVGGAAADASGAGSVSLPSLVNLSCVEWKIVGACVCGWPPKPCVKVSYYEPRWMAEVVKKPGTSALPVLGTALHAALSVTGVPALGGGGAGNASGSGQTNINFSEVRIWSFPQVLGGPCTACAPVNAVPVLHYASEMDAVSWRTATAIPLPPPALLPVGVWGNVYPRTGNVIHGSPPIAAALAAVRAMDIVRQPIGLPPHLDAHIVTAPVPAFPTCMQMSSPRMSPCMPPGTPPPAFETAAVSLNGSYVFLFWTKRECCVEPEMSTCGITLPGVGKHGSNVCILPNPPLP